PGDQVIDRVKEFGWPGRGLALARHLRDRNCTKRRPHGFLNLVYPAAPLGTIRLIVSACSRTRSRNDRSTGLSRAAGQTIARGMRTVSGSTGRKTTPLARRLPTQAGTR